MKLSIDYEDQNLETKSGYEGTKSGSDSLDPDRFKWPFHYEDTQPILHWICSTFRPSNSISLSEISQFVTLFIFFNFCYLHSRFLDLD
ncbi:putative HAUS augmin-like complex subunit 3 [Medicago truncatula]|uniref:Putative HAUS augmin-like complex subunit 3 n=1 Tax=Medicago truncatula TaxID=3880 RepID=A0A396J399_MEDTR|nr:putative HAUS augmin-like complex subunit 3 [Medicago truncatula]